MGRQNLDEYNEDDDGYEDDEEDEENAAGDDEEDYESNEEDEEDDEDEADNREYIDEYSDEPEDEDGESEDDDEDSDEGEGNEFLASEEDEGDYNSDDEENDDGEEEEDISAYVDEEDEEEEEGETQEYEEGLVYVIMPFSSEHITEVFPIIRNECSRLGLEAQIANEGIGSGLFPEQIYQLTQRAEFIICDLTGERPNVYFELGQAYGLGNDTSRVLLVAEEGTPLHSNIASLHVYFYSSNEQLRSIIGLNLRQMIQFTRS